MRGLLVALVALLWFTNDAHADAELIAYGDAGIKIGATSIYGKPVSDAAYDRAQELVWFKSKGTLYVIDLRDPKRKPVAIAKKMPEGGFEVTGLSNADSGTDYAALYPKLEVGKKIRFTIGEGVYAHLWEDQDRDQTKAIKKIKLVGKSWLGKQKKRVARAVPTFDPKGLTPKVTIPEESCGGQDNMECGETFGFGATPHLLAVTESTCGDACHTACILHDPATGKFASPMVTSSWGAAAAAAENAASCFDYVFRDAGTGPYFNGTVACAIEKTGVTCTTEAGWTYVGWVDPK